MSLRASVREVQQIFSKADELSAQVQKNSGLKCTAGCGKCCHNPTIEAYPIEFLPLTLSLEESGKAEEFLNTIDQQDTELCPVFQPGPSSSCSQYEYRGLICRLFGFTPVRDKQGQKRVMACTVFKEKLPKEIVKANLYLNEVNAPISTSFYDEITPIIPSLGAELHPIKMAIRKAIEYVLTRSFYENSQNDHNISPQDDDHDPIPISA